jgi:hypothetical protein
VETSLLELAGKAVGDDAEEGLIAVTALREELERLEAQHVATALHTGWSWSRIGQLLGITKQAAHQRWANEELPEPGGRNATELMVAPSARLAVFMARREAAGRGDAVVGTEHLLLGMLQQGEGGACEALKDIGVTLQAARLQAELFFPSDFADVVPGRLPLSKAARAALERSTAEVVRRGDGKLENAHLLLALLRDAEAHAVQLLTGLGVSTSEVEDAVDRQLGPVAA